MATDVMRHSGQTRSGLHVSRNERKLILRIDDEMGKDAPRKGRRPGQGLLSMQERVTVLGGIIEAGPCSDGGFCVFASCPCMATL